MKKIIILISFIFTGIAASGCANLTAGDSKQLPALAAFTAKMDEALFSGQNSSTVYSAAGLSKLMMIADYLSDSESAEQFQEVFGWDQNRLAAYSGEIDRIMDDAGLLASSAWLNEEISWNDENFSKLQENFDTEIYSVNPNDSAKRI